MANVMKISGPACALLLLTALLATGARVDWVTTEECAARGGGLSHRVRQYPVDSDATGLNMQYCKLTGFQQRSITGLPAVIELSLAQNELRELPFFDEHVCANWTRLVLISNQLTGFNSGTFLGCTKLQDLFSSYNQIELIHHSTFTTLTDLRRLELQHNRIKYIPDQLFANNGKLEALTLNNNRLTRLPSNFATSLKRTGAGLDWFHFHDNPWHCTCLVELLADVKRAGVYYYYVKFYDGTAPVCVFSGAVPCGPQTGAPRAGAPSAPAPPTRTNAYLC